ncbi:unnamed protein product, partial [Durusdinium trenchii]
MGFHLPSHAGTGWRRRQREHRALLPLEVVSEGAGEAVSVSSAPSRGNRIQSHRLGELGLWKRPPSAPGEGAVRPLKLSVAEGASVAAGD